jgi:hypothetical protein
MKVITISDWNAVSMPAAVYTSVAAAIGADAIGLIGTGYAPGALTEFESIALNAPSVVYGPTKRITATTLGIGPRGSGGGAQRRHKGKR